MSLPLSFMEDDGAESESDFALSPVKQPHKPYSTSARPAKTKQEDLNQVQAVLVNTNSMMVRANTAQYVELSITPSDSIFTTKPSSISNIFEIPLVIRIATKTDDPTIAPYLHEAQVPDLLIRHLFRNCDVTACDPTAKGPYDWDHEFGQFEALIDGPVVLARLDKKPLHLAQARMILEYIEQQIAPLMDEYRKNRKRWRKWMDVGEYRDKLNEVRGDVEVKVRPGWMRPQWKVFKAFNRVECEGVENPWALD